MGAGERTVEGEGKMKGRRSRKRESRKTGKRKRVEQGKSKRRKAEKMDENNNIGGSKGRRHDEKVKRR